MLELTGTVGSDYASCSEVATVLSSSFAAGQNSVTPISRLIRRFFVLLSTGILYSTGRWLIFKREGTVANFKHQFDRFKTGSWPL